MAYQFPASPSVNDTYAQYRWDGSAWVVASTGGGVDPALESRIAVLEAQAQSITNYNAPTGADGEPADYNIVIVDKSDGSIKTIPAPDYIEPE